LQLVWRWQSLDLEKGEEQNFGKLPNTKPTETSIATSSQTMSDDLRMIF